MKMGEFDYKNVEIELIGHASFRISTENKIIYIDPYIMPKELKKADVIFITHEHFDHCAPENVEKLIKNDGIVVAPKDCAQKLKGMETIIIGPDEQKEVKGIKFETLAAYNLNKNFHVKKTGWVGYIITINGVKIYHAGDTDFIPEMKKLRNIDVALIPIGGTYTMDEKEAAEAVNTIRPKIVIPMHYNTLKETKKNPKDFEKLVESGIEVKILD